MFLPAMKEGVKQGLCFVWTSLVDCACGFLPFGDCCEQQPQLSEQAVHVDGAVEEVSCRPPEPQVDAAAMEAEEVASPRGVLVVEEEPWRLGPEALRTALGGPGAAMLAPRELGPAGALAGDVTERLEGAVDLLARARALPELEAAAVRKAALAARRLHRAGLLESLQHSQASVCMGLGRAVVLLREGRAFIASEPSSLPESWLPLKQPKGPPCEIRSVCVSPWSLLALDDRGRVLCVSLGEGGKDGFRWAPVSQLEGVQAVSVQSRFGQIYVVSRTGDLYAWGLASGDGTPARQCSVGLAAGAQDIPAPTRITGAPGVGKFGFGSAPIRQVACGAAHAIFLTVDGQAFAVGQGREGQLGHRALEDSAVPVRMALPHGVRARAAACGLRHTLLATTSGEALGCGCSDSGALPLRRPSPGALPPELAAEGIKTWAFEAVPRWLDLLPGAEDFFVAAVSCGLGTSFFLSDCGDVLMCGTVPCDPTPFGRPKDAEPMVPYRLRNLPRVREVAVSLRVPLKLPGLPFSTIPEATEAQPAEVAVFWAADEPRAFGWGSPGGVAPREIRLPSSAPSAAAAFS